MPAADRKKRPTIGVERARYTRAEKESRGGGQLRRKIGTTEYTTAVPISIDSLLKTWWRLARSINSIEERGRSTSLRKTEWGKVENPKMGRNLPCLER